MINADPQELAKFSELAHRWWDKESEFRPLHQINPLRLDWIDRHAKRLAKDARGVQFTRTDAIRDLLTQALDATEGKDGEP